MADDQTTPQSRARSSEACSLCAKKKIKCDVTATGVPCSNCSQRGQPKACELRKRAPYPPRRSRKNLTNVTNGSMSHTTGSTSLSPAKSRVNDGSDNYLSTSSPSTSTAAHHGPGTSLSRSTIENPASEIAAALLGDGAGGEGDAPYFIGDEQGIGYTVTAFNPDRLVQGKHYLIPRATVEAVSPEDLAYLKVKGVFSLPNDEICEVLLHCFFQYVHPWMPVVDIKSVLGSYHHGGAKRVNLLLLWSMFSVAAGFLDEDTLRKAGYKSRKEMKASMFRRAKCLYDCDSEDEKLVIIQSCLLMSFWYVDMRDRIESWHWVGIAIGMSQTIGLHRDPDSGQANNRMSDRSRGLWRRVWWSCFYRDRWLSCFMGRPMRISARDCDVPLPSPDDIMADLVGLPEAAWNNFVPHDLKMLAECWIDFLQLSQVLGEILATNYTPGGIRPTVSQVEEFEKDIYGCSPELADDHGRASQLVLFNHDQLRLYQQAAIVAAYRPLTLKAALKGSTISQETITLARQKVRAAATKTNSILEGIISTATVRNMPPMTVPLLVPAMQAHLFDATASDQLSRSMGLHRLELCLMVLHELDDTYPSATLIRGIFLEAVDRLNAPQRSQSTSTGDVASEAPPPSLLHEASEIFPSTFELGLQNMWGDGALTDPWAVSTIIPQTLEQQLTPDFDINTLLSDDEFQRLFSSMQNTIPDQ